MYRGLRVSRTDERLFARTREIALGGQHDRVRVGALLAKGARPLAHNHNVPGKISGEQYLAGHAERRTVDGAPGGKGTLYVARLDLAGQLAASWPCDECMFYVKACGCVTKICFYDGQSLLKVRI